MEVRMTIGWLQLILAGIAEIGMALALKQAQGWTRLCPSVLGVLTALVSVYLLTSALRHLPVATAYAIWTGIGTAGVVALGIWWFGEKISVLQLLFIGLIVVGTIGLRITHE
jgi:quaternary ammonium compound-resistance protein SugE